MWHPSFICWLLTADCWLLSAGLQTDSSQKIFWGGPQILWPSTSKTNLELLLYKWRHVGEVEVWLHTLFSSALGEDGVQLDAYAVLHPVMQNRRLAEPTTGKDILKRRKSLVPAEDRIRNCPTPCISNKCNSFIILFSVWCAVNKSRGL